MSTPVPDGAPPDHQDLVAGLTLRPLGGGSFEAPSPNWWGGDRVFGGMTVAQGLRAAAAGVPARMAPHSLHAYFLAPARPGQPVRLDVATVRDGRAFALRRVTTTVGDRPTFEMSCSFHVDEPGDEYQLPMPEVPDPDEVAPGGPPIPFELRELGPTPRRPDGTYTSTRRTWMRTRRPLPDDPTLHLAVVAYLSDMTGAAFRPHSLGQWGTHTDASLDHAVWFHRPVRADEWLLFDLQALVNAAGRATVRGVIFSRAGQLCASMAQELLIRRLDPPVPQQRPQWAEGWGSAQAPG